MALLHILPDVTGSQNFKMVVAQTGSSYISGSRQDSNEIPTASPHVFGVQEVNGTIMDTVQCNRKWEFQDGGHWRLLNQKY